MFLVFFFPPSHPRLVMDLMCIFIAWKAVETHSKFRHTIWVLFGWNGQNCVIFKKLLERLRCVCSGVRCGLLRMGMVLCAASGAASFSGGTSRVMVIHNVKSKPFTVTLRIMVISIPHLLPYLYAFTAPFPSQNNRWPWCPAECQRLNVCHPCDPYWWVSQKHLVVLWCGSCCFYSAWAGANRFVSTSAAAWFKPIAPENESWHLAPVLLLR